MSIFGQVWVWSIAAFVVGALFTWLLLVRPAQARILELERRLAATQAQVPETQAGEARAARAQQRGVPSALGAGYGQPDDAGYARGQEASPRAPGIAPAFEGPEEAAESPSLREPGSAEPAEWGRQAEWEHQPEAAVGSEPGSRVAESAPEQQPEPESDAEPVERALPAEPATEPEVQPSEPEPAAEPDSGPPPAYAFGGPAAPVPGTDESDVERTQQLPKRQPKAAPAGGFDPPEPIHPSMRPIERRGPANDAKATHSGSLFEPAPAEHQQSESEPQPARAALPLHTPESANTESASAGPFGPGSAMPKPGGGAPSEDFVVKASVTALRYCTAESAQFAKMVAEVWFRSVADAERVGFRPLS